MRSVATNLVICSLVILMSISCGGDDQSSELQDTFNRKAMLQDWSDLMIIPAFDSYLDQVVALRDRKNDFYNGGTLAGLEAMRSAYLSAYREWHAVSIFDIGEAEAVGLRNFTNIFPSNIEEINNNIESSDYNLALPSNFDAQGYPALDYLLYGQGLDDLALLSRLQEENYKTYINDLIDRLYDLTNGVVTNWENGYRDAFVENDGSSATASVDKLVNDFLFYYEKFLRAGKIGIPAGIFSGTPIATSAEIPYADIYSKEFFLLGLSAVEDFFNGVSYDNSTVGTSLKQYLEHIANENQSENIAPLINAQFQSARLLASDLNPSLQQQVLDDNSKMLLTYDELQKAVVLMKVDMLQALNIQVDFVDADGD